MNRKTFKRTQQLGRQRRSVNYMHDNFAAPAIERHIFWRWMLLFVVVVWVSLAALLSFIF